MNSPHHVVLLVDDEVGVRRALRRTIKDEGYEILEAASGEDALAILQSQKVDVIISDHSMPSMSGLDLLRRARLVRPDSLRIILTGQADLDTVVTAVNEDGIYRFLLKPWDNLDLKVMLRLAVRHLDAERRNAELLGILREHPELLEKLAEQKRQAASVARDDAGRITLSDEELALLDS